MQDFFKKHGVAVMTIRELFDFIVDPSISDETIDNYLEEVQQKILARGDTISAEDEIADSVFVQAFIPKTLENVKHAEADIDRITSGKDTEDIYYQTITGLKHALSTVHPPARKEAQQQEENMKQESTDGPAAHPNLHDSESESGTDEDDDEENSSDSEGQGSASEETQTPADRKAARKENKKKVKEEKREARKTKVPKAVKKKKKKLAKAKKYR